MEKKATIILQIILGGLCIVFFAGIIIAGNNSRYDNQKPQVLSGGFQKEVNGSNLPGKLKFSMSNISPAIKKVYTLNVSQEKESMGEFITDLKELELTPNDLKAEEKEIGTSYSDSIIRNSVIIFLNKKDAEFWEDIFSDVNSVEFDKYITLDSILLYLKDELPDYENIRKKLKTESVEFSMVNKYLAEKRLKNEKVIDFKEKLSDERIKEEIRKTNSDKMSESNDRIKESEEDSSLNRLKTDGYIEETYSDDYITRYTVEVPGGELIRIRGHNERVVTAYLKTIGDEYLDSKIAENGDFEVIFDPKVKYGVGMFHIEVKNSGDANWTIDFI